MKPGSSGARSGDDSSRPTAAAVRKSAAAGPARASASKKTTAARGAATKATAAGAAAKTSQARAVAARTAAAKSAAEKAAETKSSARTAAARTSAARSAAAKKAAATRAAKAAAAKAADEALKADEEAARAAEVRAAASDPSVEAVVRDEAAAEVDSVTEVPVEPAAAEETPVAQTLPAAQAPAAQASAAEAPDTLEAAGETPADAPVVARDQSSGEHAIRIRGLVKSFGDHTAVNGIDLTVPAGSFYGIVGPNGAGKTTTLSIVAGLLRADGGEVVICGIDQSVKPLAVKRLMGVLPDRLRTFDRLTGRQLLYYYGLLRGLASDVIEKRVGDLARAFDLGDALGRVVSDYSAGMTKKLMLAGAMIHSPRVLVLDEPFEAVDPVSSAVILDILRAYVAHGGTVILSSHGMDLVERVCSRVAIIVGGDVLAEGTIDEVRAGQTLESRFVELSGGIGEVEGLEWLHTFSD